MPEFSHDPTEYIRGLQQLLISDKKRIGFLCGAGTSLAKKNKDTINIPAVKKMTEDIETELKKTLKYATAIEEIKTELTLSKYNIETLLTCFEEKRGVVGSGTLNGLTYDDFTNIITETKRLVRNIVCIHPAIFCGDNIKNVIHVDFAEWIGRADRKYPIEIFTTNYDYLFEIGLEDKRIPYYDGFTGSYNPFFYSESVEDFSFLPRQTKLWKIHGSLGWHHDTLRKVVVRKDTDCDDILIYPSSLKYVNSKKQPYLALMDRLSCFVKKSDSVLIVTGYSFNDEHINERIITSLKSTSNTHVYVLYYDELNENSEMTKIAKENSKLSVFGRNSAIIGCQYGIWKMKQEPSADELENVEVYFQVDKPWTGKGELLLPNFAKFVEFLKSVITSNLGEVNE